MPKVSNPTHANFLAASWRWTPTVQPHQRTARRLQPDLRLLPHLAAFRLLLLSPAWPSPTRSTNSCRRAAPPTPSSLSDDAAWQHGRHYIQFGFHGQDVRVRSYDDSGVVPSYSLAMGVGSRPLRPGTCPASARRTSPMPTPCWPRWAATSMAIARLSTSPAAPPALFPARPYVRHFLLNDYDIYGQDKWKLGRTPYPHRSA